MKPAAGAPTQPSAVTQLLQGDTGKKAAATDTGVVVGGVLSSLIQSGAQAGYSPVPGEYLVKETAFPGSIACCIFPKCNRHCRGTSCCAGPRAQPAWGPSPTGCSIRWRTGRSSPVRTWWMPRRRSIRSPAVRSSPSSSTGPAPANSAMAPDGTSATTWRFSWMTGCRAGHR